MKSITMYIRFILIFLLPILVSSCQNYEYVRQLPTRDIGVANEKNYAEVEVFYGTNRKASDNLVTNAYYSSQRGKGTDLGMVRVSIPRDHRMGELEQASLLKLEFRANPEKHIMITELSKLASDKFYAMLKGRLLAGERNSAFIFVHGYNVGFVDAARRTAQMAYDLAFPGVATFFSWPSEGDIASYTVDEANIEWAEEDLTNFIQNFLEKSGVENVFVIGHSMGNRGLTKALINIDKRSPILAKRIREIIIAAPDIDKETFQKSIAPALVNIGAPVTLYVSSVDKALIASKKVHGYSRAGDVIGGVVLWPGIETIDASNVSTDLLGHSYYGESSSILSDLFYIIRDGKRAAQRALLKQRNVKDGAYWVFSK